MAKRGPKPKRKTLRALTTTDGQNGQSTALTGANLAHYMPRPPDDVLGNEDMLNDWNRLSIPLYQAGLLTMADEFAFTELIRAMEEVRACDRELGENGRGKVEHRESGSYVSGWYRVRQDAKKIVTKYMMEFGMTPGSRVRIEVANLPAGPTHEVDPLDQMLGEG